MTSLVGILLDEAAPLAGIAAATASQPEPACNEHACCCPMREEPHTSCCCLPEGASAASAEPRDEAAPRAPGEADARDTAHPTAGRTVRVTYLAALECAGLGTTGASRHAPSVDRHAPALLAIAIDLAPASEALPSIVAAAPSPPTDAPDKVPI